VGRECPTTNGDGAMRRPGGGLGVAELTRKHGVRANTIYQWRARFGGMSVAFEYVYSRQQ
jgi:hypothetical protein